MDYGALKEAGLTDGEVKVYTSLLKLGMTTSGPLVEESKVSRSIIYQIIDKLIEKGLASYIIKDKTKYFQAKEPVQLISYVDERKKSLDKTKEDISKMLPFFDKLRESAKESSAQIYLGFKGMQTAQQRMYTKLKKGEEYYCWGIFPEQEERYHSYWQKDHLKRVEAGIKVKLLFNSGTDTKILKNRNSYKWCDARYMPPGIETPAWFLAFKDTVLISTQDDEITIEIINQKIADSFISYFNELWKRSKSLNN